MLHFALLPALVFARSDEPFRELSFADALSRAAETERVVMVDFFTTWCAPCKQLDRVTWKDEGVRSWLAKTTVALKIDAEIETELAERYAIDAYPSILFIGPDGDEIGRVVGYRDPAPFLTEARDVLAGVRKSDRTREELDEKGWNQPMLRHNHARELVRERRFEEALEHYLWCFDEGVANDASYSGVRVSFLLNSIAALGTKYPPALAALRARRDAAMAELMAGRTTTEAVTDFSSINSHVGDEQLTLEVYDRLADVEAQRVNGGRLDARQMLFWDVVPLLLDARRYEEIVSRMGRAKFVVSRLTRSYRLSKSMMVHDEEYAAYALRTAVEECARFYEAAVGTRANDEDAELLLADVLELDDSPETREVLARHARRAERPEVADAILGKVERESAGAREQD